MSRAAVLIGVDRCGGLPPLKGAAEGARSMEAWAKAQGIEHVKRFADDEKPVEVDPIFKWIEGIIEHDTSLEQLIVYFAGHGYDMGYGERWLLSGAPGDANAAINLEGCATLARTGKVPHVVMVADACRTAARGSQALRVTGSLILPNERRVGPAQAVDRFYACLLGDSSAEALDPAVAAAGYKAIYTDALLDGLSPSGPADPEGYIRPNPLKDYLQAEVPRRVERLRRTLNVEFNQEPDAQITSRPEAWISRHDRPPGVPREITRRPPPPASPTPGGVSSPSSWLHGLLGTVLYSAIPGFQPLLAAAAYQGGAFSRLAEDMQLTTTRFGRTRFETHCGFNVRGAQFVGAFSPMVETVVIDEGRSVRLDPPRPGVSVVLILHNGTGLTLPAIPEYIASLTFQEGALIDVSYEPADNSGLGERTEYTPRMRELRAIAASSTRNGIFKLEREDAFQVAREMQEAKLIDPAFAIYAAYAYESLGRPDLISEMRGYLGRDLGAHPFDLALLTRELDGKRVGRNPEVLSFLPLLAQGWALMPALALRMPPSLERIERHLLPSVWTLFDRDGVRLLYEALASGEVG